MPALPEPSLTRAARRMATLCAAIVAAIAACVLLGWAVGLRALTGHVLHDTAMKANTALAFIVLAGAVALHARDRHRSLVAAASIAVMVLAAATFAEWVTGVDLGIDEALVHDASLPAAVPPGRMAPTTAVCLTLLAAALLADHRTWRGRRLATGLVVTVTGLTVLAVISLIAGMESVDGVVGATRMAAPTAAGLLLLAGAALASRPRTATVRLLTSGGPGGVLARRLLPLVLALPLGLEATRVILRNAGTIGDRASMWLYVFALIAVASGVVVRLAHRLDDADAKRQASEELLRRSEAFARSVTDTARDAIICSDGDGDIISFNASAERMFGREAADVIGQPLTVLMPKRLHAEHALGMQRVVDSGDAMQYGRTVELRGIRRDGHEFDIELAITAFTIDDGIYVTAIVRDVSERKLLEAQLRAQAESLEQVIAAQAAIAAGTDLDEILGMVAARAAMIVGADGGVVALPDGDHLVYRAAIGIATAQLGTRIALDGTLSGAAMRSNTTMRSGDSESDARVAREAARHMGVRSMVCVPLRHDELPVGVLQVGSSRADAFSSADERTLELLAGLAGAAIRRAQSERRLAAHHTVSRALAEADTLEAGLSSALGGLAAELGWDVALAWLVPEGEETARLVASWQDEPVAARPFLDACRATAPSAGEDAVGRAWGTARSEWADDIETYAATSPDARARAALASGLRSAAVVPVVARGEALGAIELASSARRPRDADTIALLEMLASQIGQFVQRKRAEERVAVHAAHLEAVVELSDELSRLQEPAAVRPALCRAILTITDSDMTAVLEPDAAGRLVITAQAGEVVGEGHAPPEDTVVVRTFREGRGGFFTDAMMLSVPDRAFLQRTGLRAVHLEPLMRDGRAAGVLAIGSRAVRPESRAELGALVRLLVAETGNALERTDLVAALDASARTDQLTGVPNRRAWDEALPRELARARRAHAPVSVAMVDLDHFKAYNDAYGHPAGDRLLREVAAAWTDRLRTTDLLARFGGEEFAIVLPGCGREAAAEVVRALRDAVPDGVTFSTGVATWDGDESPDSLVARADAALYQAKNDGRDRVVVASAATLG